MSLQKDEAQISRDPSLQCPNIFLLFIQEYGGESQWEWNTSLVFSLDWSLVHFFFNFKSPLGFQVESVCLASDRRPQPCVIMDSHNVINYIPKANRWIAISFSVCVPENNFQAWWLFFFQAAKCSSQFSLEYLDPFSAQCFFLKAQLLQQLYLNMDLTHQSHPQSRLWLQ